MSTLNKKVENAVNALDALLDFAQERLPEQLTRFEAILDCLRRDDCKEALYLYKSLSFSSMGGLGDKWIKDDIEDIRFNILLDNVLVALGNLRVFFQYDVDRELVDLSEERINRRIDEIRKKRAELRKKGDINKFLR